MKIFNLAEELEKERKKNKELKKEIKALENQLDFIAEQNKYIDKLEKRINKAIEYIENKQKLNIMFGNITLSKDSQKELLNILKGDNK